MQAKTVRTETPGNGPPRFGFGQAGRHRRIQEAAYFLAEKRYFAPGHELDDWFEAERQVDQASVPFPSY